MQDIYTGYTAFQQLFSDLNFMTLNEPE